MENSIMGLWVGWWAEFKKWCCDLGQIYSTQRRGRVKMAPTKTLQFDRVYNKAGCPWEDCLRLGTSNCTLLFRASALYCSVFPMHCYIWIIFAQFETNHILIYRHKTPNMNTFFIIEEPWLDLNNVRVLCCKSGLIVADMQFLIRKEISFVTLITFVFSPTVKEMMVKFRQRFVWYQEASEKSHLWNR